jgi:microcystin-dependent protein
VADPTTPNYGLIKPSVGLDRDVWGDLTNENWDTIDTQLKAANDAAGGSSSALTSLINTIRAYIEPIGSIKPWPSPTAPAGWFPCDGWEISRTDYAGLFAVLGTMWGGGNGSTTFNIPNFLSSVPVHRDNATFGVTGRYGEINHTLSVAEMPLHGHPGSGTDNQGDHAHSYHRSSMSTPASQLQPGSGFALSESDTSTGNAGTHWHNVNVAGQGGGAAHNNIQPSVGVLWIIKAVNLV